MLPLTYDACVQGLALGTRAKTVAKRLAISTVKDLVMRLAGLGDAPKVGARATEELRSALAVGAMHRPKDMSREQLRALCEASGCDEFAFDIFGRLFRVGTGALSMRDGSFVPGEEVLVGVRQALSICEERGHPVFCDSYLAAMPWYVLDRLGRGRAAQDYCDVALEATEDSAELAAACAAHLAQELTRARMLETVVAPAEPLVIPSVSAWEAGARLVERLDAYVTYDSTLGALRIDRPTLSDWLNTLDPDKRDTEVVRAHLGGATFEECGRRYSLTRERVRQIVKKALAQAPVLYENRFRRLFTAYGLSKAEFCDVTGEPVGTFLYLRVTHPGRASSTVLDVLPLSHAIEDEALGEDVRGLVRAHLDEGYVYVDNVRLRVRRDVVLKHLAARYAADGLVTLAWLRKLYDGFLQEHGLESVPGMSFQSLRTFEIAVDRCDLIMRLPHAAEQRYGGSVRFYDASTKDFEPLRDLLVAWALKDMECSCALLMCKAGLLPQMRQQEIWGDSHGLVGRDEELARALANLDVHNEYELHYVIGTYCLPVDGVHMLRSPNMAFGAGNRLDQMLELVRQMSPVTASELSCAYGRCYGIDATLVQGYYLNDFQSYLRHGKYVYSQKSLLGAQQEFVVEQLSAQGRDYCSLALLKARFADRFPGASPTLLNAPNLAVLGYRPSFGLLVREGIDERAMFGQLLDQKSRFCVEDEEFGRDVVEHRDFMRELAVRQRSLAIVEYERGCYMSTALLRGLDDPVEVTELRDYVESALAFMDTERPYTVHRLRRLGFSHSLDRLRDEVGFGDYFYTSVLTVGRVGGRVKSSMWRGTTVFCKTPFTYSIPRMLEQVMRGVKERDVEDLAFDLEREYGLVMDENGLRSLLRRSSLYFCEELDVVFDSEGSYRQKAREWLAR